MCFPCKSQQINEVWEQERELKTVFPLSGKIRISLDCYFFVASSIAFLLHWLSLAESCATSGYPFAIKLEQWSNVLAHS